MAASRVLVQKRWMLASGRTNVRAHPIRQTTTPVPASGEGLAEAVTQAARAQRQKLAGAKAQLRKAEQRGDRASIERWRTEVAYLEA
jgi:hypothetical protein